MSIRLTQDEVILVLDTYFQLRGTSIGPTTVEVTRLSHLLKTLEIHPLDTRRDPSFRPPDGVDKRVRRFQEIEQGSDSQVPPLYLEIWEQFAGNRKALRTEVERIKLKYSRHELERDRTYSWAELGELYGFDPEHLTIAGGMVSRP